MVIRGNGMVEGESREGREVMVGGRGTGEWWRYIFNFYLIFGTTLLSSLLSFV